MGLSMAEQETVITWDREGAFMNVYTADPYLLARLKKLDAYKLIREHRQEGKVIAADFEADKKLCFLRPKLYKKDLTEEQRAEIAKRFRKDNP